MTTDTELRELDTPLKRAAAFLDPHNPRVRGLHRNDIRALVDQIRYDARRLERAKAEVARLRDTMRRSPQMSRVWQAEEETERLRERIKALADELHRVDVAMLAGGVGPASMSVRDTVRRLRSLLQEGE